MKVGIISDSHDAHQNVLSAIKGFNARGVEYVFHAGDVVSPFTAKAFEQLDGAQLVAVFGNCDGEKIFLASTIKDIGGQIHGYMYRGEIEGRRIFMTHIPGTLDEVVASGKFDLVIYGHTHKRDIRKVKDTLIVNPGEATDWITGESSIVVVDLSDMSNEVISLP